MNSGDAEAAAASKKARCKKEKKKKRKDDCGAAEASAADEEIVHDKKRKKQLQQKKNGDDVAVPNRKTTVSIAVAGSIIDNAQSLELATLLAGQIARAATVFRIDEVVVFDSNSSVENSGDDVESGARFLVRILQYLETPQYLRRRLFPMHNNLKFVGLLPPLDAPHHLRKHEWSEFREGVTLDGDRSMGTFVDVGLSKNVLVEQMLEPGKRVTIAMGTNRDITTACKRKIVSPSSPRDEMELYWGYKVRYASNLGGVFSDSPYKEGYDYIIGTSEHGKIISSSELILPSFRHLLIAFGGLAGLEECIEEDRNLKGKGVDDVFNTYLNTCPSQGSRTIRTEEALLISLQYFQDPIRRAG
ncbi:uncharacterized protein [Oryza sativa Japonica Group]|uniref:Os04g0244500 protein n=6 Tax=Oryza TaxID=4527 RepID=Q0JEM0_ORYSJ|nr:putative methyltransferase C9orf114 [Oryza sativa Japonica Group]KAB8095029.1 hypothetical protein EE612_022606 [Oryza sativa]KAF2933063.1 hypothetical protein DAI22_04g053900 [Oryza sativa Japonica Group]CAH67931.1 H0211F06-OSIGBa0153M17.3 [Oryza sativa]BAF14217.1 Os04g0244500 [Oryza sativa Japonica Group]BAG89738.1 unnamed protein product [Oryza sativa Japonica Group]|eukprot:NP_001052303.1 Os04g0244500 [Oryza sativa Japonica Group]